MSVRLSEGSCFKANNSSLWSFLYKAFNKQTTREIKCTREMPKVMLNLSVRPSQSSCLKLLYESSKRPALFVEEHNEKLQSELRKITQKVWFLKSETPTQVFFCECWYLLKTEACNVIKKRLQHRCSPVEIAIFLRRPALKKICERLFLRVS